MLGILIPIFEPMGWKGHPPGTLLGYSYTWGSLTAIAISSALGLLVSLSTFLVIGATSSLTYNVVGGDTVQGLIAASSDCLPIILSAGKLCVEGAGGEVLSC